MWYTLGMKRTYIIIAICIIILGGLWYFKKGKTQITNSTTGTYRNARVGVGFTYPKILSVNTTDDVVTLHHDIPYLNTGACDMMGDTKTYERLTDFNVTIRIIQKNLTDTVRTLSPYIPQENFINDELVASPGFIETFKIGKLSGFAIYEGAEGCGQTTYYFSVGATETLVVNQASIQALSTAIVKEARDKVLAVPGVISPSKSESIFNDILKSLSIQ